jgi:glycopeptide antibiotics resistance protein
MSLPDQPPPTTFQTRRAYGWLTVVSSVFVLYVSLIPFDFRSVAWDEAWNSFRSGVLTVSWGSLSRSNFLANVLLFIPIGFFGTGALLVDRHLPPTRGAAPLSVLAWAVGVSLVAEFLQVFEADRIPHYADVWAQAVGAAVGILGWVLAGSYLTNWFRSTAHRSRDDRLARVLEAYVIFWMFIQLAPFDINADLGFIAQRLRALLAESIPWREPGVVPVRALWNVAATTVAAIPIGVAFLVAGMGRGQRRSVTSAIGYGCAIITLIEAAQFLLVSHTPSVDDVLVGCAGVAIGVIGSARVLARGRVASTPRSASVAWVVLAVWAIFIIAYHWQPYDFTLDSRLVQRKLASMSLLPFAGYYRGSELKAFSDLLLKVWLSLPLGAAAGWAMFRQTPGRVAFTAWFVLATGFFAGVEAGQLLLPSRVPDPTDVLTGVVTSGLGLWLARWVDGRGRTDVIP